MIDTTTCETFDEALDRVCESIGGDELMNELVDVQDLIVALCKRDKDAKVGEVVQAVFNAYVERAATRSYYGQPMNKDQTAQEAAAAVMAK